MSVFYQYRLLTMLTAGGSVHGKPFGTLLSLPIKHILLDGSAFPLQRLSVGRHWATAYCRRDDFAEVIPVSNRPDATKPR